jgi:hypothetical protein
MVLEPRRGLWLPPDVIQPFPLRFRRDDLHVMAFFEGHRAYESVEAMIKYGQDGSPSVRAILTRHDQEQIDHVNDEALVADGRGVDRQICYRAISVNADRLTGRRRARVEFVSFAGERIVLDITTVSEPDPKRGGISNPGGHSPNSSLPLMLRGASTLAGPQSEVRIDGKRLEIPRKLGTGPVVAHEGYYTERHLFAAIRAGTTTQRIKARPDQIVTGAEWIFEGDGGSAIYRVAECDADGQARIARRDDSGEIITADVAGDRLAVSRISRVTEAGSELDMIFEEEGRFRIMMDGQPIVMGAVETCEHAGTDIIRLCPVQPDWAAIRQVRVACTRDADLLTEVTMIGGDSSAP